jgi:hypothetical protein
LTPLHQIGEDQAEMLDYVPAQFRVRLIRRPRLRLLTKGRCSSRLRRAIGVGGIEFPHYINRVIPYSYLSVAKVKAV